MIGFELSQLLLQQFHVGAMFHQELALEVKDGDVVAILLLPLSVVGVKNVDSGQLEARIQVRNGGQGLLTQTAIVVRVERQQRQGGGEGGVTQRRKRRLRWDQSLLITSEDSGPESRS